MITMMIVSGICLTYAYFYLPDRVKAEARVEFDALSVANDALTSA